MVLRVFIRIFKRNCLQCKGIRSNRIKIISGFNRIIIPLKLLIRRKHGGIIIKFVVKHFFSGSSGFLISLSHAILYLPADVSACLLCEDSLELPLYFRPIL
ncbi:hypothetical protein D3C79_969660 [compost metagenome]